MITANEIRYLISQEKKETEEIRKAHERNQQEAINFANTIMHKNFLVSKRKATWLFKEDEYNTFGDASLPLMERCIPFEITYTPTNAQRLTVIDGFDHTISLSTLKQYLEQHGYRVSFTTRVFLEESWSHKTEWHLKGYEMNISWDKDE